MSQVSDHSPVDHGQLDHGHEDDGQVHAHISSFGFYLAIFGALICLTLLTVAVSNVHLGKLNLIVAVIIASMKASLVLLFFMHLRYDSKFNGMIVIVSILFIGVFFAYTLNDTDRRGEIDLEQGVRYLPKTGAIAPGGLPPSPVTVSTSVPEPKLAEPKGPAKKE
jgi:cytochrome c oxidase subunit 4